MMHVYYRGPWVLITDKEFLSLSPSVQAFTLRDLVQPQVVINGDRHRGRRRSYEVHAIYYGRWVCLFRTTDLRLFGQIKRALIRALEAQGEFTLYL